MEIFCRGSLSSTTTEKVKSWGKVKIPTAVNCERTRFARRGRGCGAFEIFTLEIGINVHSEAVGYKTQFPLN